MRTHKSFLINMRQMKRFVPAIAGAVLLVSMGTALAQVVQPKKSLTVFDANGRRIASIIDANGQSTEPSVALEVDGVLLVLTVYRNNFVGRITEVFFELSDCSGTLLTQDSGINSLIPTSVAWSNRVYVLEPNEPPRPITVNSKIIIDAGLALVCEDLSRCPKITCTVQSRQTNS